MAAFLLAACAGSATAQPVDPDFELNPLGTKEDVNNLDFAQPLGTWRRWGDVGIIPSLGAILPPSGSKMVILTTDRSTPTSYGKKAQDRWATDADPAMNPAPGYYGWLGFKFGEGFWREQNNPEFNWVSAMHQAKCPYTKGDVMSFRWKCLTNETNVGTAATARDAGVFYIMDAYGGGTPQYHTTLARVQTNNIWNKSFVAGYQWETAWKTHKFTMPKTGKFDLAFAVGDLNNTGKITALLVDDIQLTTAAVVITPPDPLTLSEGQTGNIQISLATAPAAGTTVTVTLNPNPQLTYAPSFVTFNSGNWNNPKTVAITAVDNLIKDGNRTATINVSTTSAPAGPYNGLNDTYDVFIIDNETPGIIVDLSPNASLSAQEGVSTATYNVKLQSQPAGVNMVMIALTSPDNQVMFNPPMLIFDTNKLGSNYWDAYQTVIVTPIDDNIVEGNHTGQILHTPISGDPVYNALTPILLIIDLQDNPNARGGEGAFGSANGPPPGFAGGGEGGFGFGREHMTVAKKPIAKKAVDDPNTRPILFGPFPASQGEFTVHNVSQRRTQGDAAPTSASGPWGVTLMAGLALGLVVFLGMKLIKPA